MPIRMDAVPQFLPSDLVAVCAVYGASFIFLALTIYLQPKEEAVFSLARHLWLLGVFSLVHVLAEFYDLWRYASVTQADDIDWTAATLLTASYLPLFEFARRAVADSPLAARGLVAMFARIWIYLPIALLLAFFTLWSAEGAAALSASARYFLAFPGGVAAGTALYISLQNAHRTVEIGDLRRAGAVLGGGLIAYGVLAGLIVHHVQGLPVWMPTHESFLAATGMPIHVIRALAIVVVGLSLADVERVLSLSCRQRERQALAQLHLLTERLEERVAERTAELELEVAERRRTEAALRASEDRLKEAERLAQMGGWELDLVSNRLTWSDEIFRIFELDSHRFGASYQAFLDLVHPDDRAAINKAYSDSVANRAPYEVMHRLQMPDGRIKYVIERGETLYSKNGTPLRTLGTVQDITERRRAEAAAEQIVMELRESERRERELHTVAQHEPRRMAALLSAMSTGILVEDQAGYAEYVNPAFRRMWGIDDALDLTGRPIAEISLQSSHRLARPDHASKYLLRARDTPETGERFEMDLCDGRILTQLSYPVTDPDGRVLGRLWIYDDITQQSHRREVRGGL